MKNKIIRILVIFMFLILVSIAIGKIQVDAYEYYDNCDDTRVTSFRNLALETAADTTGDAININRMAGTLMAITETFFSS